MITMKDSDEGEVAATFLFVGNDLLAKIRPGDNVIMAGKQENVETPEPPQDSYACVVRRGRVKK